MSAAFESVVLFALTFACGTQQASGPPTSTVPGPEANDIAAGVHGTIVLTRPVGGIESVRLPQLETSQPRKPDAGSLPVFSVSGPDSSGRVAFIENDMLNKRHALKVLRVDGTTDTVFEAAGDALWEHSVGEHLAFDPSGRLVALVARAKGVQNRGPDALMMEGELEIWNVDEHRRVASSVSAMDDTLAWFPDGKRLAYASFVDHDKAAELLRANVPADDAFGRKTSGWARVPVVHEFELETGHSRALHVGERPLVSTDGKLILVRDFELHWRILDLESNRSRAFEARGAIYPGAIAFVDPSTVLFWAWPTDGADIGFTTNNSPLVGSKQMRALKLIDLRDGRFQTVVPGVDPRRAVAFGR